MRHSTTGRSPRLRRKTALIVAVTMLAALTTGIAYASGSGASGPSTLYLCFQKNVGNLRLLDGPGQCRPSEQELNVDLTGAQGPVGPAGAQGPAGPQGAKGDTGAQGAAGSQGAAGPAGQTGPQGEAGPAGLKGETGAPGPQGDTGLQGAQGVKGETGAAGPQGETGPQGPAGPAGKNGVGHFVVRSIDVTVAAGADAAQTINCQAGESVTGGGVHFIPPRNQKSGDVVLASFPDTDVNGGTPAGWRAAIHNGDSQPATARFSVICAS